MCSIRQWVYRDGNGLCRTIEQITEECYAKATNDEELDFWLYCADRLYLEPMDLKDENYIVWMYHNDVELYELNGVLYLLADELSEAVCVINI